MISSRQKFHFPSEILRDEFREGLQNVFLK